jgi:hypothetical protein
MWRRAGHRVRRAALGAYAVQRVKPGPWELEDPARSKSALSEWVADA